MVVKALGKFILLTIVCCAVTGSAFAQTRAKTFTGNWNWAVYGKDKSDLPPAYRDMDLKEVPAYAVHLTLKQRGKRLTGSFGVLARYLARVDEGDVATTVKGNRATVRLTSNFGGSATVVMTLQGNKLLWKVVRSSGENYFPKDTVLRRLRPGEKLPYEAEEP
jgi:hypothetical protein